LSHDFFAHRTVLANRAFLNREPPDFDFIVVGDHTAEHHVARAADRGEPRSE